MSSVLDVRTNADVDLSRRPRLAGVGVGPGDPELLTLKAVRTIQAADIVFAPVRRPGQRSLAIEIVGDLLDASRQEIMLVPFPNAQSGESWATIAATIVERLGADGTGVFLTEGDPLLFGSFGNLMTALRARCPELAIETVPGISSVMAAAAAAGVPLVDGNEQLAIVPATLPTEEIARTLLTVDCTILIKVGPVLGRILSLLARLGLQEGAIYVRRCGQPGQEIITDIGALADDPPGDYFALLIVHRR
jgi:precorrin-2/cobalt-factor-2 C20-methyltransferase